MTVPTDVAVQEIRSNTRQWEAYEEEGHCAVLAGPGSGKTKVLVAKVARLIGEKTRGPRGVACITYNNECVRELKSRLAGLGLRAERRLYVGTVHSFCLSAIVAPFGHLFRPELATGLKVAGARQRQALLQQAIAEAGLGGPAYQWETDITKYRRHHPVRDETWLESPDLARAIERYEALLLEQGLIDFDSMVSISLKLVRTQPLVRAALEARFPFLVIDEYQDLGYPLHLIVRTLMEETEIKIFAVGDPDQSIYGFAGADPRYLRELAAAAEVHRVQLEMNYRCAQRIITSSQVALAPEVPQEYQAVRQVPEGDLFFVECPEGLVRQADVICHEILPRLQQEGVPNSEIAILYIDRRDAEVLGAALQAAGVEYAGERDQKYPRTPFTRWLEEVAEWCCLYPKTGEASPIEDLNAFWIEVKDDAGSSRGQSQLVERTEFFEALQRLASAPMPLGDWLSALDEGLGIERNLDQCLSRPDDLEDWRLLRERCQAGEPLEGYSVAEFARGTGRANTITLTTLHSSKGLEYQVVIMPGLEQGRLPGYNATTPDAIAEARRVFYVGMTRAKDAIHLLYSGWYRNAYGRIFSPGPSQFMLELKEQFVADQA